MTTGRKAWWPITREISLRGGTGKKKKKIRSLLFEIFSGVIKVPVSWMPGRSGGGGREGESELNGPFRSKEST